MTDDMRKEVGKLWFGKIREIADALRQKLSEMCSLSPSAAARTGLVFRQYVYDRAVPCIHASEKVTAEEAEMIGREIYTGLMEDIIVEATMGTDGAECMMVLLRCEKGIRDRETFSGLLTEIVGAGAITEAQIGELGDLADKLTESWIQSRRGRFESKADSEEPWMDEFEYVDHQISGED